MELPILDIVYEDDEIFVLNKPPRIHSVALEDSEEPSLGEALIIKTPSLQTVAPRPGDGGLVQRLDRDTSGLILGAKSKAIWETLHQQILRGDIKKSYLILCEGEFTKAETVHTFLGNPNRGARKVRVYSSKPPASGRALPATSHFTPLQFLNTKNASLVRVEAPTARRHQVRAHASFLNHPLLGDSLYGSQRVLGEVDVALSERDYFLHAETLSFHHPRSREKLSFTAPSFFFR